MSTELLNDSDSRGKKLDDAILEFLRSQDDGIPLDIPLFLEKHAAVSDDVGEFINQHLRFGRATAPLREFSNPAQSKQVDFKEFGDYEIIREIGRGGMGVIYEAKQKGLTRHVALKMIRDSRFQTRESFVRFQAEAEAAAALEHPNIVPVYRVDTVDNLPFFTMKLIKGGSLKPVLAAGPLGNRESARMALAITRAISFAHQRGILHRDVKPANILLDFQSDYDSDSDNLDPNEANSDSLDHASSLSISTFQISLMIPLVSDFGLAKQLNKDHDEGLTVTGAVLGTPSFMSPEQASGETAVTTSTDIYSIGAILYNMLAGTPPFTGSTPAEITQRVIHQIPKFGGSRSNIDLDLKTICLKCLEKSPADRYLSANDLAEDLDNYMQGKPIRARQSSSVEQVWKWAKRNRAMASLVSALAIVMLVTLIGAITFSVLLNKEVQKRGETLTKLQVEKINTIVQRSRNGDPGIYEDLNRAISLSSDTPDLIPAEAHYERAQTGLAFNQREHLVVDLERFLELETDDQIDGQNIRRMEVTQQLAWHLGLKGNPASSAKALQLARTYESWVTKQEGKGGALNRRVLANKTLGLALLRSGEPKTAIRTLERLTPTAGSGIEFLLATCYAAIDQNEKAKLLFQQELTAVFPNGGAMRAQEAVDWLQLRSLAQRSVHIELQPQAANHLRWSAIELAASSRWEIDPLQVQFFYKVNHFLDLEKSREFAWTNEPVSNIFWNTDRSGGKLSLQLHVPHGGKYSGRIGLVHSFNYGVFEFELNGERVGDRFDAHQLNQVVFGDGVEFNDVDLRTGINHLSIINVGKSPRSGGYGLGVESLEFTLN